MGTKKANVEWLLVPYVDSHVEENRDVFLKALADKRKQSIVDLKKWLRKPSNVRSLLISGQNDLKASYKKIARDLNVTCLCLYSGPKPGKHRAGVHIAELDGSTICSRGKIAWLGTGDAELKSAARRLALLRHYRNLLSQIKTMTLPHHGSDKNFHTELLDQIDPSFNVAAAANYKKNWKHPGPAVKDAVRDRGKFLKVVGSELRSEFFEVSVLR